MATWPEDKMLKAQAYRTLAVSNCTKIRHWATKKVVKSVTNGLAMQSMKLSNILIRLCRVLRQQHTIFRTKIGLQTPCCRLIREIYIVVKAMRMEIIWAVRPWMT